MKRLALGLALVAPAAAAQQPSPNDGAAAGRAVLAIGRAAELAITGRREGDAGALVDAAQLMLVNGSQAATFGTPEEDAPASLDPRVLLEEAERLAGEDDELEARIEAVRDLLPDASRPSGGGPGAESGPLRYGASVAGGTTRRHQLYFSGPEAAVIQVRGSGATNLDVYLYDVNGDRVAFDEHASDVATLHWYVPYTQTLTLVVRNRGPRSNAYYVITN